MKKHAKIDPRERWQRRLGGACRLPPPPIGECLDDDELAALVVGVPDAPMDMRWARAHMESCAQCRASIARLACLVSSRRSNGERTS